MNKQPQSRPNGKAGSPHHQYTDHEVDAEDGKYDPGDFIIPASDAKGHSERVWCRLQPGHDRQLDVILRSRKFPFRTKGDIIRWATVRGLRILEQMEEVPSVMKQVDMIMDVLNDEQLHQDCLNVFDKTRERVASYIAAGSSGQARRLVATLKMHTSKMPDDYWRGVYMDRLEKEFGYLLEGGSGSMGTARASRLIGKKSNAAPDPDLTDDHSDENEVE